MSVGSLNLPLHMPKNIGPSLAPLLLRLSLGLTFVWAGLGKIEATFAVKGDQAVLLASMGVDKVRAAAASGKTVVPQVPEVSKPAPTKDTSPLPVGPNAPALTPPSPQPVVPNPNAPEPVLTPTDPMGPPWPLPAEETPAKPAATPNQAPSQAPSSSPQQPQQPAEQPNREQTQPVTQPTSPSPQARASGSLTLAQVTAPPVSPNTGQPTGERVYVASEFPDDIQVPRVYSLAMLIYQAGHPPKDAENKPLQALWPTRFSEGAWPLRIAWTVALCELIGGLFVLVGLLTRVSALMLAATMIGAIWLTEVGPAIQAGKVVLGFIPDRDFFTIDVWKTLLWQLSLLMSAGALAMLGCGSLGLDRKFFPPPPPPPVNPRALI